MNRIQIEGGNPLKGSVKIQGSKNAALPILAASVLHKGVVILENCPHIADVEHMLEILRELGSVVTWEKGKLILDNTYLNTGKVSPYYAQKMRSSIFLLGSLLSRIGEVELPYPGGCVIGARPIDIHLDMLSKLGATLDQGDFYVKGTCVKKEGAELKLSFPSVGATENCIMLAVLAKGRTIIENAAREPEIIELCRFLEKMGANIKGAGSSKLIIDGVSELKDVEFSIVSDRIVAGTYLLLASSLESDVVLEDVPIEHLTTIFRIMNHLKIDWKKEDSAIRIKGTGKYEGISFLKTEPYPGFSTDLQSILLSMLSVAKGKSVLQETVFEARFQVVEQLVEMGANIKVEGDKAYIYGVKNLIGTQVKATELRGGAALILAGCLAEGTTQITGFSYIERGYENIIKDLQKLGIMIH